MSEIPEDSSILLFCCGCACGCGGGGSGGDFDGCCDGRCFAPPSGAGFATRLEDSPADDGNIPFVFVPHKEFHVFLIPFIG